ncbi:hypothetical protein APASM_5945 [Actinosynnema pretiosum subsp. pretiosum]|nr:hypothetical protein APASM_5945 [Actinosynnema pretiosum subsp. pretiosum]
MRARLIGEAGAADPETPPDYPADRIERIRESLPPPVVVGAGQQTRGRWIAPNGRDYPISSGLDSRSELVDAQLAAKGLADRETIRKGDVEMKLAADMAATGIRHVTVVINHRPCRGRYNCHTLVPILLPEGYTLTVYGITSSGTRTRVRYTGGAEPWWR